MTIPQKGNPNENLTFDSPLDPNDATAQIGEMLGLDDAGVVNKIPWLGETDQKVILRTIVVEIQ